MNDEDTTLHPWIEPELEARLTALVLGEASDFERDELERLITERPELALYRKRLEAMHRMLREVAKGESGEEAGGWRLAEGRREALLAKLGAMPEKDETVVAMSGRKRRLPWGMVIRIAACVAVAALVLGVILARSSVVLGTAPGSTDLYAYYGNADGMSRNDWFFNRSGAGDPESVDRFDDPANGRFSTAATPPPAPGVALGGSSSSFALEGSSTFSGGVTINAGTLVVADPTGATAPAGGPEEANRPAPTRPAAPEAASPLVLEKKVQVNSSGTAAPAAAVDLLLADGTRGKASVQTAPAPSDRGTEIRDESVAFTATGTLAMTDPDGDGAEPLPQALERELAEIGENRETDERRLVLRQNLAADAPAPVSGPMAAPIELPKSETNATAAFDFAEKKLKQDVEKPAEVEQLGIEWKSQSGAISGGGSLAANQPIAGKDISALSSGGVPAPPATPAPVAAAPAQTSLEPAKPASPAAAGTGNLVIESGATVMKVGAGTLTISGGTTVDAPMPELQAGQNTYTGGTEVTAGRTYAAGGTVTLGEKSQAKRFGFIAPGAKAPAEPELAMRKQDVAADDAKGVAVPENQSLALGSGGAVAMGEDFLGKNVVEFDGFVNFGDAQSQTRSAGSTVLGRESEVDKSVQDILALTPQANLLNGQDLGTLQASTETENRFRVSRVAGPSDLDVRRKEMLSEVAANWESPVPAALAETSPEAEPFSTFSLHVSDVSFQLAKAALASGKWPEAEKIRIEEFVNAFDYGDPMPGMGERVAARIDQAAHPFLQQRNLVRIALRTAEAGRSSGTPLRLTLLLDSSGSMERPDRRETVRRAFATLAGLLGENDRVTLVSFARQPRLVADAVVGNEAMKLAETVAALPSEGGTNLEAALQLAFEKAREHQDANAQNRIVLLTDGAANLGDAKAESLGARVEMMRESGIAFDAAGFGAEGLNDEILEALTRKGDGRYYLLDRPEDAEDTFAKQIAGALRPAAKNVKVQVEFNPDRVKSYKLLGFEKHRLETEDFRNDAVDAAEMAAAEAGVAVYQVEPIPGGEGDLGSVSVRFRDLDRGEMVERRWALPHLPMAPSADEGGDAILLATVASQFAAKLAGGPLGDVVDLGELARLAAALPESERVKELRTMIEQARNLEG